MTEEFSATRAGFRPLTQIDTVLLATLQERGRLRLEDQARQALALDGARSLHRAASAME